MVSTFTNLHQRQQWYRLQFRVFTPDGGLVILVYEAILSYYLLRVAMDGAPISTTCLTSGVGEPEIFPANTIIPQPDGSHLHLGGIQRTGGRLSRRSQRAGQLDHRAGRRAFSRNKAATGRRHPRPANRFQNGSAIVMNALTADGDILWWNEYPHPLPTGR